MPPEPRTTPTTALQSLLSEIHGKKDTLANMSEEACNLDTDELEAAVRHCVETDAVLCVAEAIVLASLKGAT